MKLILYGLVVSCLIISSPFCASGQLPQIVRMAGTSCTSDTHVFYVSSQTNCQTTTSWNVTSGGSTYQILQQGQTDFQIKFTAVGSYKIRATYCGQPTNEITVNITSVRTQSQVTLNGPTTVPFGQNATFTAIATAAGTSPSYIWTVGSVVKQNGSSNSFIASGLLDGNVVSVGLVPSNECITSSQASKTVTVSSQPVVSPPPLPVFSENTCGPMTLTLPVPPAGVTWYWQGTNPNSSSESNSSNSLIVTASGSYYVKAKQINPAIWSAAREIKVVVDPVDLVLSALTSTQASATHTISLKNGFNAGPGQGFTGKIHISSECNDYLNYGEEILYDENAKPISRNRVYTDGMQNVLQSQQIDYVSGKVWSSQPLYNSRHEPVAATLSAPIVEHDFIFKKNFVQNSSGQIYGPNDFDKPILNGSEGEINSPIPVGKQAGSLGWYYSANNTLEPNTPVTGYPYNRALVDTGPDKATVVASYPGDQYKMGSGHEVKRERKRTLPSELSHYYAIRSHFANASSVVPAHHGYKYIATDGDGKQTVSFIDVDGNAIASALLSNAVYEHWSYQYYNDMGQLVVSISPAGVKTDDFAAPAFSTVYVYDNMGRVSETFSSDEGRNYFLYSTDGKIRFSQNQLQHEATLPRFSYINYDRYGRIIESGEYTTLDANSYKFELLTNEASPSTKSVLGILDNVGFTGITRKESGQLSQINEWSFVYYDIQDTNFQKDSDHNEQENLMGQISTTESQGCRTWYSYDEFGQVTWTKQLIEDFGIKTIDYGYNYFGSLTDVTYQKNNVFEEFRHFYEYDGNERLTKVFTSFINKPKILQSSYSYYLHGPLKRVELGSNVQGIDYVYNIDGSLKLINHPDPKLDPGKDGSLGINQSFMPDVFGEALDYNTNDYTGAGYNEGNFSSQSKDQFAGNLKSIRWHNHVDQNIPRMYTFTYDKVNQLDKSSFGDMIGADGIYNAVQSPIDSYLEDITSYDDNGNIQGLKRKGKLGNSIADYTYLYKPKSNRLDLIQENGQTLMSFIYDAIGRMTSQSVNGIETKLQYNVQGLVTEIRKNGNLLVSYKYDDRGNRYLKTEYDPKQSGKVLKKIFYVFDFNGDAIAVYEQDEGAGDKVLKDLFVYGLNRIGLFSPIASTMLYEVSDHLGNIRGVIGNPEPLNFTATLEDNGMTTSENPRVIEADILKFRNISSTAVDDIRMNHSVSNANVTIPSYSSYLHWVDGIDGRDASAKSVGPTIALNVEAGDRIDIDVWAKFQTTANYSRSPINGAMAAILGNAFAGTAPGIDVIAKAKQVFENGLGVITSAGNNGNDPNILPYAYLYYLYYDNDFNYVTSGWKRVSSIGGFEPGNESFSEHEKLQISDIEISEPGYVFIFVANESENTRVWFDDLAINHRRSAIVAGADYYPFGLAMENRETDRVDYRYGYQGQSSETVKEVSWNSFELRMYDPKIARWTTKDPYGQFASPYVAMGNVPNSSVDPDGGFAFNFARALAVGITSAIIGGTIDMATSDSDGLRGAGIGFAAGFIGGGVSSISIDVPPSVLAIGGQVLASSSSRVVDVAKTSALDPHRKLGQYVDPTSIHITSKPNGSGQAMAFYAHLEYDEVFSNFGKIALLKWPLMRIKFPDLYIQAPARMEGRWRSQADVKRLIAESFDWARYELHQDLRDNRVVNRYNAHDDFLKYLNMHLQYNFPNNFILATKQPYPIGGRIKSKIRFLKPLILPGL